MNESQRTPAPDFQEQLNALAEEMSDGLGRQAAIDRLIELGLCEEDADDQEASIREQLHAIHRGARAIFRDLDNGLERKQAVLRFQELGMSRAEAVQALDGFQDKKRTAQQEAKQILEGVQEGMEQSEAVTRFRDLGLGEPLATLIVGMRSGITAHWHGEQVWLGGLAAGVGAALLVVLGCLGPHGLVAYLIPSGMVLYGLFFAVLGWRKRQCFQRAGGDPRALALVKHGHGRCRAISQAVEDGVPPTDAALLVNGSLDGMVRIYRWFVALGLLAVVWGLHQAWAGLSDQPPSLWRSLGALALVVWGSAGSLRGLLGWRRFAKM